MILHRGWIIPNAGRGVLWGVNVRRPDAEIGGDGDKYRCIRGTQKVVYGLDTLAGKEDAIIVEGEFDALLLRQHVGPLCGCLALGSASKGLDAHALRGLVRVRRLWLALDADEAGQEGASKLLRVSHRMHLLTVPEHDVTDAWRAGHDLAAWVVTHIGPRDAGRRLAWAEQWLRKLFDAAPEPLISALLKEWDRARRSSVECGWSSVGATEHRDVACIADAPMRRRDTR